MSSIGLPNIDIEFIQKAVSAIDRSERGVLCLCLTDSHVEAVTKKLYKYQTDIKKEEYDEANYQAICKAFLVAVNKVYVIIAPDETESFSTFTPVLEGLHYNYIAVLKDTLQQELATYIVQKNANSPGKKYIAVVANATVADSKYIINLKGDHVHEVGAVENTKMNMYLPRIASILCNLPMNRSITYYQLEDLDDVDASFIDAESNTIDAWINKGYLVLFKEDDIVKVARGVNSLTTFTSSDSEDMRKIIIVESMNIIIEDIYNTFRDYYVGKYKNSYDNQRLFISAVNSYFRQLQREEILDPDFDNHAFIDVELQRAAWLSVGKTEAEDWSEDKVKEMTFKSYIYLAGSVKILDAIEDLKFTITMA